MTRNALSATMQSAARIQGSHRSGRGVGYIMPRTVPIRCEEYKRELRSTR
jgi:hypothetical protein